MNHNVKSYLNKIYKYTSCKKKKQEKGKSHTYFLYNSIN